MDDYVMGKLPQLKFQINLIIDKVKILKTQAPETEEDAYHYDEWKSFLDTHKDIIIDLEQLLGEIDDCL